MVIPRDDYLNKLIKYKDKDLIKVITGVRRCGKSVLLFDIFGDWLLSSGIPAKNIIKINLEDKENSADVYFIYSLDNFCTDPYLVFLQ